MSRSRLVKPAAMIAVLTAVWLAGAYGPMAGYVQAVKQGLPDDRVGFSEASTDGMSLREWVEAKAAERGIAPTDAVIDRVWKAIPGYEGREVDVEATVAQAQSAGLSPNAADFPWVYRSVPPKIHLDDLPLAPIYRGNPSKPMVALMINVAWGDEYLPDMLDTLDAEKVKATFFLDGTWLAKHEETARDLLARGHELSNHAYTHPNMSRLNEAAQRREIERTEQLLQKLDVRNRWFAPPSGDYNEQTVKTAGDAGLRTVLWTLDTVDWKRPPASSVIAKVAAQIGPGQLVLMHPTATTRDALKGMIKVIRDKGLRLGTVTDTLSETRVEQAGSKQDPAVG